MRFLLFLTKTELHQLVAVAIAALAADSEAAVLGISNNECTSVTHNTVLTQKGEAVGRN